MIKGEAVIVIESDNRDKSLGEIFKRDAKIVLIRIPDLNLLDDDMKNRYIVGLLVYGSVVWLFVWYYWLNISSSHTYSIVFWLFLYW